MMRKTVVPFRWNPRGAGLPGAEVFVRASLTDSVAWDATGRAHEVEVRQNLMHPLGLRFWVERRDIVAMVIDPSKYAYATETREGVSMTFATPEAAAEALKGMGWTVQPPEPRR